MQVRHTASVHVTRAARPLYRRRRTPDRSPAPRVVRVPEEVLRVATELAEGDPARLRLNHDGSVTVVNRRR